jgi:hypothetical protein
MIDLTKIQKPFENDIHAKYEERMDNVVGEHKPLPKVQTRWGDMLGINYSLTGHTLTIRSANLIPDSIIKHINSIDNSIKIIFLFGSDNNIHHVNYLLNILSNNRTNKDIIVDLTSLKFSQFDSIELENLPNNIKITNTKDEHTINSNKCYYGFNSFDSWALWLAPEKINIVTSKLTSFSRNRLLKMHDIVYNFYRTFPRTNMTDYEKTEFAFDWLNRNTDFDSKSTKPDGNLKMECQYATDPIITYERGLGVCAGRARLMKILLNNYYVRVNCFLTDGKSGVLPHEWNEVYLDGQRYYYDTSFSKFTHCNMNLNSSYRDIRHDDFEVSGLRERMETMEYNKRNPLPPRKLVKTPTLPNRKDNV